MKWIRSSHRRQLFNHLKFDFHAVWANAFDKNGYAVTGGNPIPYNGQTGEIGRKHNKAAEGLEAADDAAHRFSRLEMACVFQPGAQQLPMSHGDAALIPVDGPYGGQNFLPLLKAVFGMLDA